MSSHKKYGKAGVHYSQLHRNQILEIEAALVELNASYADLSRVSGVPSPTISQVINGKYPSAPTSQIGKLEEGIDRLRTRLSEKGDFPFCETSVYLTFRRIVEEALTMRHQDFIGLATGHVGVGKSWAIKEIVKRVPTAIYMRASSRMSQSAMIDRLMEILKLDYTAAKRISNKQNDIVRVLRGKERVIIFDEATRCGRTVLECLRDISDEAEIGLVFAGREQLYERFSTNTGEYAEISSRIISRIPPIRALPRSDIELMTNSVFPDLEPETMEMIWQCSQSNARELRKLIIKLVKYQSNRGDFTPEIVSHIYTNVIEVRGPNWQSHI